jgi:glycerol kinase
MQLLADLSQRKVIRSNIAELSALGVAAFAGLNSGEWQPAEQTPSRIFEPILSPELAAIRRQSWHQAINKTTLKGAHNG